MAGNRKLGRETAHRNLMLRGLVTYLLENGQIETTFKRAKEVSSLTDKMITLGKEGTLAARRQALAFITKEDVVTKLFSTIAPQYANKNGGYTAVYKLGPRRGDGAEMALIALKGYALSVVAEETKADDKKAEAAAPEAAETTDAE